ncbi:MAG: NAD-dependent epimerase/dehydratase family protein [Owenweeksia sp.]
MKKLLLTGGTGFLGNIIYRELSSSYEIHRLGRSTKNEVTCNLAEDQPELEHKYDVVVHTAGKAHMIPRSRQEMRDFFRVNYEGTLHLTKALEEVGKPDVFIFISSVAVYGAENGELIDEETSLDGHTPYARSKIQTEEFLHAWSASRNVPVLILRLPLIAGPNPRGNLGKMISGIRTGKYLSISGGKARRSAVMARDVARLIPSVEDKYGVYNLTDGYHPSFRELEKIICRQVGRSGTLSIPGYIANLIGSLGDILPFFPVNSNTISKMTNHLTFDDSKARRELGWKPEKVIDVFEIE